MGKFVKGAWIEGCTEDMIGKKIVRVKKCICKGQCGDYEDYSYCINGLYGRMRLEHEEVTLDRINEDGSLHISWMTYTPHLPKYWNDDNWVLSSEVNENV